MVWLSIKLILMYRVIAPTRLRESCLFEPTCSEYAIIALKKYGFLKGWFLSIKRIVGCKQPHGGVDYP
ncbi:MULTISPECIES: membrane protein insertion efficiency factor YidD [Shewanella]|uniref:membrane protein insertion efficiency factor YidD n=1 Tax=Shewanella TaxID=22 RepID=UPI000970C7C6|nr:membrane protein insertion efficiency factor YidD [Shewanella baltica]MCS6185096.1 membrane protein insertion efficiency factor YidD [Shewanella baltica]